MSEGFDLELLKTFLAVMEARSLTVAARQLGLTQPTISKHVAALEARFGARLLHRDGRGIQVTRAGYVLAERIPGILDRLARIGNRQPQAAANIAAAGLPAAVMSLRIAMPAAVAEIAALPFLAEMLAWDPRLDVCIGEHAAPLVAEALRRGELDIGVLQPPPDLRGLAAIGTHADPLHLIVPPRGPMSRPVALCSALGQFDFALPPQSNEVRRHVEAFAAGAGQALRVRFEVDSPSVARQLVRDGHAASFLPWSQIAGDVASGSVTLVRTMPLHRSLCVLVASARLNSSGLRRAAEALSSVMERQFARGFDQFQAEMSGFGQPVAVADEFSRSFDA